MRSSFAELSFEHTNTLSGDHPTPSAAHFTLHVCSEGFLAAVLCRERNDGRAQEVSRRRFVERRCIFDKRNDGQTGGGGLDTRQRDDHAASVEGDVVSGKMGFYTRGKMPLEIWYAASG